MGIGETRLYSLRWPDDTLRARDLSDRSVLEQKLALLHARLAPDIPGPIDFSQMLSKYLEIGKMLQVVSSSWLPERVSELEVVVFEGAQGVLLDQDWGFQPHTTWSDTTMGGAIGLLDGLDVELVRVGVVRAYATRHGAGPLPTEGTLHVDEPHNDGGFAGAFRTGAFDLQLLKYALAVNGAVDELCVTHLDHRDAWPVCVSLGHDLDRALRDRGRRAQTTFGEQAELTRLLLEPQLEIDEVPTSSLIEMLAEHAPVEQMSHGPTRSTKVWASTRVRRSGR